MFEMCSPFLFHTFSSFIKLPTYSPHANPGLLPASFFTETNKQTNKATTKEHSQASNTIPSSFSPVMTDKQCMLLLSQPFYFVLDFILSPISKNIVQAILRSPASSNFLSIGSFSLENNLDIIFFH